MRILSLYDSEWSWSLTWMSLRLTVLDHLQVLVRLHRIHSSYAPILCELELSLYNSEGWVRRALETLYELQFVFCSGDNWLDYHLRGMNPECQSCQICNSTNSKLMMGTGFEQVTKKKIITNGFRCIYSIKPKISNKDKLRLFPWDGVGAC